MMKVLKYKLNIGNYYKKKKLKKTLKIENILEFATKTH